jgi:Flp pilus assembly protein TadG
MRAFRRGWRAGEALVEFALVCFLLVFMLLAAFEIGRMLLVYNSLANAARVGVRYASVHGNTNTGSGMDGPSGPGNTANVETIVRNFARTSLLDVTRLNITVSYPTGGASANAPGSRVRVRVLYVYDPFMVIPLGVRLGSRTEGVIVF